MNPEPEDKPEASPQASVGPGDVLSRREFLIQLALMGGWTGFGLTLLDSLSVPVYEPPARQVIVGKPADFALGVTPLPLYQAWLVRKPTGFYALRAVCTHLGCPPVWQPARAEFHCPCHGSRFDAEGALRQGPALRALERIAIYTTPDGRLALNLDQSYRREDGGWKMPGAFVNWPESATG